MDKATVLDYMKRANLFGFEWLAQYISDVTNVFLKYALAPGAAESSVQQVIQEMAKRQKKGGGFLNEECIKLLLFDTLEYGVVPSAEPEEANKIPWPNNDKPLTQNELAKLQEEAELQKYTAEMKRFKMRTRNIQFSERFVEAAKSLEGWFHWVKSGPTGGTFFPSETTSEGETNHFVRWIHGRGDEPTKNDNMNCWEAVLFAAYKAGLVSIARLRAIHIKATMAARAGSSFSYFDSLTDSLGYQNSFPYVPRVALVPAPGDVVFMGGDHHVAVCVETGFSVKVMSNWTQPNFGFNCYDLEEFTGNQLLAVRFGNLPV